MGIPEFNLEKLMLCVIAFFLSILLLQHYIMSESVSTSYWCVVGVLGLMFAYSIGKAS